MRQRREAILPLRGPLNRRVGKFPCPVPKKENLPLKRLIRAFPFLPAFSSFLATISVKTLKLSPGQGTGRAVPMIAVLKTPFPSLTLLLFPPCSPAAQASR